MIKILFYISGHGLGHGVRSLEVMRSIIDRNPDVKIYIRTTVSSKVFNGLDQSTEFESVEIDVGAVQNTSLWVDRRKTLDRYLSLEKRWKQILDQESYFIKKEKINLIIGDIPPLGFRIAYEMNIKSIAIGNFGWDWIYASWQEELPEFESIVKSIKEDYKKADMLLRLPAHGPMESFKIIEDIPLIARESLVKADVTRRRLDLNRDKKNVLIALPPSDIGIIPWEAVKEFKGFRFLCPFSGISGGNIVVLPGSGVDFQDVVSACDAVISKPGYGIVSECFANRTPLLSIQRYGFVESEVLIEWMRENMACGFISIEDFLSGRWENYLEALVSKEWKWSPLPVNGAEVAADRIIKIMET